MIIKIIFCSNKKRKCPKSLCPEPFQAQIAEDMVMLYQDFHQRQTSLAQLYQEKSPPQNVPFCFWWMSCTYNGWALPRQINQTWHCPSLEHLGRPRDRIKGSLRPWTLSVPNTHSELENSYPAHFSHHHLRWLCLLVIGSLSLICSSRIPQRFRHGFCRGWAQYSQTRQ